MESLLSDIPAEDGKIANLFLQCTWTTWITYFLCFCYADDLDELVLSFMTKENGDWVCTACGFTKRRKYYVVDHVEAKVRLPISYIFYEFLGNGVFFIGFPFLFESM